MRCVSASWYEDNIGVGVGGGQYSTVDDGHPAWQDEEMQEGPEAQFYHMQDLKDQELLQRIVAPAEMTERFAEKFRASSKAVSFYWPHWSAQQLTNIILVSR